MTVAAPLSHAYASQRAVQRDIAQRIARAKTSRRAPNVAPVDAEYGFLKVLGRAGSTTRRRALYDVFCRRCETTKRVLGQSLRKGATNSCGCLQRDITSQRRRRESFRAKSAAWFQRRKGEA